MTSWFIKSRLVPKLAKVVLDPVAQQRLTRMKSKDPLIFIDCEVSRILSTIDH